MNGLEQLRNTLPEMVIQLSFVTFDNSAAAGRFVAKVKRFSSSPCSLSDESSPKTDFISEPRAETSKYRRKRALVEGDNYVT